MLCVVLMARHDVDLLDYVEAQDYLCCQARLPMIMALTVVP